MKISFMSTELAETLSSLKPCAGSPKIIQVLGCVLFVVHDNKVTATTTNGFMQKTVTIKNAKFDQAGLFCVDFTKMLGMVSAYPKDKAVSIKINETEVVMSCGRSRVKIPYVSPDSFPAVNMNLETPASAEISALGEISTAMSMVSYAGNKSETRPFLKGITIDGDGNETNVVASDSIQIACQTVSSNFSGQAIIPFDSAGQVMELLSKSTSVEIVSRNGIYIFGDGFSFYSQLIDSNIMPYKKVMPAPNSAKGRVVFDPDSMSDILKRISVIADNKLSSRCTVSIPAGDGEAVFEGFVAGKTDRVSELLTTSNTGSEISSAFDPKIFSAAMARVSISGEPVYFDVYSVGVGSNSKNGFMFESNGFQGFFMEVLV